MRLARFDNLPRVLGAQVERTQALIGYLRAPQLQGWWLARDAPPEWLARHPRHCLAHYLDLSAAELAEVLTEAKLFGQGVKAKTVRALSSSERTRRCACRWRRRS